MGYIISFILPLIFIVLFTETLCLFFKNDFKHSLPFTFIINAIILYISLMVFKTIYVGLGVSLLISLVFPIYLIKNKYTIKDIKKKYLTNDLISFFCLYIFIFLYDLNRFYTRWDELSHWGKMVKEIIRIDNFYSVDASHLLVHKDYPPIFSLMETFYTIVSGGFKETYLIRCIHLFEGSLVISALSHAKKIDKKKTIINTLISIAFVYIVTFLFDSEVFINSIYIDYPLAMLVGYMLFNVFKETKFNKIFFIKLSIASIFLLLTKQVSISLYLVILFMLFIRLIGIKKNLNIKKILYIVLTVIIIPINFFLSWNLYKSTLNLEAQFVVKDIEVSKVVGIMYEETGETWQQEASKNYMDAVLSKNISSSYFKFTYFGILIVLLLAFFIINNYIKDKINKNMFISLIVSLLVGFFGYIVLMYLSYVFQFGPVEGPELASFDRYMSTYVLLSLYTIIFILIYYLKVNWKYMLPGIIVLMVIITPKQYLRLRPDLIILPNHHYDDSREAAKIIDEHISQDDRVFIVDQKEKNGAVFYVNYFSDKARINRYNFELTDIKSNVNILKNYDYLYTYSLYNNDLELHKLYKIETINGKLELVKVSE